MPLSPRPPASWAVFLLAPALSACSAQEPADEVDSTERLMPFAALSPTPAEQDPLSAHRPNEIDCSALSGWYLEDNLLEANTAACNYLSLSEEAATTAHPGDTVIGEVSYFDLTAAESTEAHLALTAGSRILWQTTLPIPSPANVIQLEIEVTEEIPLGEVLGIHLHNHGQNTWNFSPLQVQHRGEHAPPN